MLLEIDIDQSERGVVYGDDNDTDIVDKPPLSAPFTGEPGTCNTI